MATYKLNPIGFWSYSRQDDEYSGGRLSQLRARLSSELQINYGRERVQIFQDSAAIPYGADWEKVIWQSLARSSFFIPILTPNFVQSEFCMRELEIFMDREKELRAAHPELRDLRLIFPISYISMRGKEGSEKALVETLAELQWLPFERLRHFDYDAASVREKLTDFAGSICSVLDQRLAAPAAATDAAPLRARTGDPRPIDAPSVAPVPIPDPRVAEPPTPATPEPLPAPATDTEGDASVDAAVPVSQPAWWRRTLFPPERRGALAAHALGVTGIAALVAAVLTTFSWGQGREDRGLFTVVAAMWVANAFLASYCGGLIVAPDRRGLKGGALHVLAAVLIGIPTGCLVAALLGLAYAFTQGGGFFYGFALVMALVIGAAGSALLAPVHALGLVVSGRAARFRKLLGWGGLGTAVAVACFALLILRTDKDYTGELGPVLAAKGLGYDKDGSSLTEARAALSLPETAGNAEIMEKLKALPDRQSWIVAEDGSWDGSDLARVLERACAAATANKIVRQTVLLKPGTYRVSAAEETFTPLLGVGGMDCRVALKGEAGEKATIVEVASADTAGMAITDSTVEGITLRQVKPSTSNLVEMYGNTASLTDVAIEARTTAAAISHDGSSATILRATVNNPDGAGIYMSLGDSMVDSEDKDPPKPTPDAPGRFTIRQVDVHARDAGLDVSGKAAPIVEESSFSGMTKNSAIRVIGHAEGIYRRNRIDDVSGYIALAAGQTARPRFEGNTVRQIAANCVGAYENAVMTLVDNDFRGCVQGDQYALWVSDRATIRMKGNRGIEASDQLVEKRGTVQQLP